MRKNSKFEMFFKLPSAGRNSKLKFVILIGIAIVLLAAQSIAPSPSTRPETLTEDERFILNPPPAEASKSVLKKHAQTVAKLAKVGDSLEIKDCHPSPLVLKTQLGSNLEIKNQSTTNHRIIIDSKHYYDVPAYGSKVIKAEFKYGTGDYGYVCEGEGKAKIAGFLHVVP